MKITTFAVSNDAIPTIFGLGDDSNIYVWDGAEAKWRLHQTA